MGQRKSGFKGSNGTLHRGFGDGFRARVAEAQEDLFGALGFIERQEGDGVFQRLHAEVCGLIGALDAIQKGGQIDELAADIHGMRPLRAHPVYSAAKAGLIMLTKSLARELGPDVRVNAIAPGPVLWPEGGLDPTLQDEIVAKTALKRTGSPDDIAPTHNFFAADAPYVTGQVLPVDG